MRTRYIKLCRLILYLAVFTIIVLIFNKGLSIRRRMLVNEELVAAVKTHDVQCAEALILRRANIETIDRTNEWRVEGSTPLAIAAANGDVAMVKMLIKHGANPNGKYQQSHSVLSAAVEKGRLDIVRLLLDAGSKVDGRIGMNVTPLMLAARGGHDDIVALLIARGSDVNAKDDRGFKPLSFAMSARGPNRLTVIERLRHAGAQ